MVVSVYAGTTVDIVSCEALGMTPTIILNGSEYSAFRWTEAAAQPTDGLSARHSRNETLLHEGVGELGPGEVYFESDQTFPFDSTFSLKGDGRKFVVIASQEKRHVAKPY